MSNNNTSSGGIGFTGLLTILFIALKLTHVIAWSWWWVLSPIWISVVLTLVVLGLMFGVAFVATVVEERRKAEEARACCEYLAKHGGADWRAVLLEEVFEAMAEDDLVKLRAELVQSAAVCVAWIEDIDSRTAADR